MRPATVFAALVCALVAAGVLVAFVAIGTPTDARRAALDRRRERDLTTIAQRLRNRKKSEALPMHLRDAFADAIAMPSDPETLRPYAYRRIDAGRYRLCATFSAASDEHDAASRSPYEIRWPHRDGTTCFTVNAADMLPDPKRVSGTVPANATAPV